MNLFEAFKTCEDSPKLTTVISNNTLYNLIQKLIMLEYINIDQTKLYQTTKGIKHFKAFCEACECNPCDCNWGN